MLIAAGLAAHYEEDPFDTDRYERARAVIDRLIRGHEPYPAVVLDRQGTVIASNSGAERLFGSDLQGTNIMQTSIFANPAEHIENWPEMAVAMLARSRAESLASPLDETIQASVAMLEEVVDGLPSHQVPDEALSICPRFRIGDQTINTMVIAARFDNAVDVTIDELRIELIYPMDDEAEAFFRTSNSGR